MTFRARARNRLILHGRLAIGIAAATIKRPPESAFALRKFSCAAFFRAFDACAGRAAADWFREFAFRIIGTGEKRAVAPLSFQQVRAAFFAFFLSHAGRGFDDRFAVFPFGDFLRRLAFRIAAARQK